MAYRYRSELQDPSSHGEECFTKLPSVQAATGQLEAIRDADKQDQASTARFSASMISAARQQAYGLFDEGFEHEAKMQEWHDLPPDSEEALATLFQEDRAHWACVLMLTVLPFREKLDKDLQSRRACVARQKEAPSRISCHGNHLTIKAGMQDVAEALMREMSARSAKRNGTVRASPAVKGKGANKDQRSGSAPVVAALHDANGDSVVEDDVYPGEVNCNICRVIRRLQTSGVDKGRKREPAGSETEEEGRIRNGYGRDGAAEQVQANTKVPIHWEKKSPMHQRSRVKRGGEEMGSAASKKRRAGSSILITPPRSDSSGETEVKGGKSY